MKNIKEILDRPLPAEAIKQHPSRPYLSTINPIFVIDRFNEAFGIGGWTFNSEIVEVDKMVVVKVVFVAPQQGDGGSDIRLEGYGGNDNDDRGDAYKGAVTDALTKIGSFLGIGADIWRGRGAAGQRTAFKQEQRQSQYKEESAHSQQSPQSSEEDRPWLNLFTKTGDITELGQQLKHQLRRRQVTVDRLKEQYKISRNNFKVLVEWSNLENILKGGSSATDDDDLPF